MLDYYYDVIVITAIPIIIIIIIIITSNYYYYYLTISSIIIIMAAGSRRAALEQARGPIRAQVSVWAPPAQACAQGPPWPRTFGRASFAAARGGACESPGEWAWLSRWTSVA